MARAGAGAGSGLAAQVEAGVTGAAKDGERWMARSSTEGASRSSAKVEGDSAPVGRAGAGAGVGVGAGTGADRTASGTAG